MISARGPRVMIVDDHALVREAVRGALARAEIEVVAEASSAETAEEEAVELRPDVILVDVELPGSSGIDLAGRLAARLPTSQVVMLTVSSALDDMHEAIRLGAVGYLTKDVSSEALARAVRGAYQGEFVMPRRLARNLIRQLANAAPPAGRRHDPQLDELTERERSILAQLAEGRTTREIAESLVLSPRTVEGHVGSILRKLGARNRTEAIARYRAHS